ncbi:MAG: hypothetical protein JJ896_05070 [Rhodothermales bacterium]|nr:hypothetical protein [Rhodothermales bacterium]
MLSCVVSERAAGQGADDLLSQLRDANSSVSIERWVVDAGGTPLLASDEWIFLARGAPDDPPHVVGDFNDGGYAAAPPFDDGRMQPLEGTDWFYLRTPVVNDARFEYLIRTSGGARRDPLNEAEATTFGTLRSVVTGSSTPSVAGKPSPEVKSFVFTSAERGNTRSVSVYLPEAYHKDGPPLPTLYVHDGSTFRDQVGIVNLIRIMTAMGRMPPVVTVLIDPVNRGLEYGTAESYRRMFLNELIPEVERRYSTGGTPERRAILGASRGALAALDLVVGHPDVFSYGALVSPALSPLPIVTRIETLAAIPARFAVYPSRFDTPSLRADGRALATALTGRATGLKHRELPVDHSPHGWALWMDIVLEDLAHHLTQPR